MSFLLLPNWQKLNADLWSSLEERFEVPEDMYIELLRFRLLLIGREELDKSENAEALNDSTKAGDKFMALPLPSGENNCVSILGEYYTILRQFGRELAEEYRRLLQDWITAHNLRYKVTEHCRLELSVEGTLLTEYEFLKKSLSANRHRSEAIVDVEKCLAKLGDVNEARNCIRAASNVLEGIVVDRSTLHEDTLGKALPGCQGVFPHESIQQCVERLWKFCNDYPNLRHPGTPTSSLRNLKKDDALLMLALTVAFGTYIMDNDASDKILSGNI
jgi:hypothetical protein